MLHSLSEGFGTKLEDELLPSEHREKLERGRKKVGVYLSNEVIEDLKRVGLDLHNRGFGGNISDVLRLVLRVCKNKDMLDASYLTRAASEFGSSTDLRKD